MLALEVLALPAGVASIEGVLPVVCTKMEPADESAHRGAVADSNAEYQYCQRREELVTGKREGEGGEQLRRMQKMVEELVAEDLQVVDKLKYTKQQPGGDNTLRRAAHEAGTSVRRFGPEPRVERRPRSFQRLAKVPWKEVDGTGQCVARRGGEVGVGERGVEAPSSDRDQQEYDLNPLEQDNGRWSSQHGSKEGGRRAEKGRWSPGGLAKYDETISAPPWCVPALGDDDDSSFSWEALRIALPPSLSGGGGHTAASAAATAGSCGDPGGSTAACGASLPAPPQKENTTGCRSREQQGYRNETSMERRLEHKHKSKTSNNARRAADQQRATRDQRSEEKKAALAKKCRDKAIKLAREKKRRKRPERRAAAKAIAENSALVPLGPTS